MATDAFGNEIDPTVGYARGWFLASSADEVRRLRRAQQVAADVVVERLDEATLVVRTTRTLGAQEGLTVAVGWPLGMVSFPGPLTRAWRLAAANWIVLVPVATLFLLLRTWRRRGRDVAGTGSVVVRYEPPANDLYVLALAVQDYDDDDLDLKSARKDATDVIAARWPEPCRSKCAASGISSATALVKLVSIVARA